MLPSADLHLDERFLLLARATNPQKSPKPMPGDSGLTVRH